MTNNEFKKLFEQSSFYQESPEWSGAGYSGKDFFYVPELSSFGDTLIQLAGTYEGHSIDCLVIEELIRKYRNGEIK